MLMSVFPVEAAPKIAKLTINGPIVVPKLFIPPAKVNLCTPVFIALGPIKTGVQRLTLAGGINNLGTTIGPLIVSFAIFGAASTGNTDMSIESVKIPYLVLGLAFLLV